MRVIKKLARQFNETKDAEAHYFPLDGHVTQKSMHFACPTQQAQVHIKKVLNQGQQLLEDHSVQDLCLQLLTQLPPDDQLRTISESLKVDLNLFVSGKHEDKSIALY